MKKGRRSYNNNRARHTRAARGIAPGRTARPVEDVERAIATLLRNGVGKDRQRLSALRSLLADDAARQADYHTVLPEIYRARYTPAVAYEDIVRIEKTLATSDAVTDRHPGLRGLSETGTISHIHSQRSHRSGDAT